MMRRPGRVLAAWLVLAVVHGPAGASAEPAAPAETDGYGALVSEAVAEFNAGHWAEAHALFARAYAQQPNARVARGLGLAAYELRHYAEAVSVLQSALDDTRNALSDEQRVEVGAALDRARRYVGRVRIELVPYDAELRLAGNAVRERELTLDVGDYEFTARAAGYKDARFAVNIEGGQSRTVNVELVALSAPSPAVAAAAHASPRTDTPVPAGDPGFAQRVLGFTGLGLGAAGLVTGLVFELQRSDKVSDRDAICPTRKNCTLDDDANNERLTREAETASAISVAGWIAGGVFTAAGLVLLLTADSGSSEPTVALMPSIGHDGAGFALHVTGP